MHTNDRRESSIVTIGIAQRLTRIVNLPGIQQTLQNRLVSLEDGAVLMQVRYIYLVGHVLKRLKVFRVMSTKVEEAITVVVDQPTVVHLESCRTFHHLTRKRLGSLAPRTIGRLGKGHFDVALRTGVVFQHHHVVSLASLHQCGVNAREPRINHQLRRRELLEVLRGRIVETMVVLVVFQSVRELARNTRCPDDDSLLLDVVPEQLRSPYVDGGGIRHHLDETLLAPVYQILRTGIAKAQVTTPRAGPYQMERAIRCTDDRGVAHHTLFAHLRSEPHPVNSFPVPTVVAVDKAQTVSGWLVKRCRKVYFALGLCCQHHAQQQKKDAKTLSHVTYPFIIRRKVWWFVTKYVPLRKEN